jgi:hypothetical protein
VCVCVCVCVCEIEMNVCTYTQAWWPWAPLTCVHACASLCVPWAAAGGGGGGGGAVVRRQMKLEKDPDVVFMTAVAHFHEDVLSRKADSLLAAGGTLGDLMEIFESILTKTTLAASEVSAQHTPPCRCGHTNVVVCVCVGGWRCMCSAAAAQCSKELVFMLVLVCVCVCVCVYVFLCLSGVRVKS